MDQEDNFYTLKGYSLLEHVQITYPWRTIWK